MSDIDSKLVKDYLNGDEAAFEELLKKYLKPVFNFVWRLTGDKAASEDLAQETFLKAWKNLKRFDHKKNFKTWLFVIAKNSTFDWFRKKKCVPFSAFTDCEGNNKLEKIADEETLADEIAASIDLTSELEEKIKEIPRYYREILLLRYKDDFSLSEIASILGESYDTVKSRSRRALLRLRKALGKHNAPC